MTHSTVLRFDWSMLPSPIPPRPGPWPDLPVAAQYFLHGYYAREDMEAEVQRISAMHIQSNMAMHEQVYAKGRRNSADWTRNETEAILAEQRNKAHFPLRLEQWREETLKVAQEEEVCEVDVIACFSLWSVANCAYCLKGRGRLGSNRANNRGAKDQGREETKPTGTAIAGTMQENSKDNVVPPTTQTETKSASGPRVDTVKKEPKATVEVAVKTRVPQKTKTSGWKKILGKR
jgi:hypothetical protein